MRVDHDGMHILMPKELLDCADVVAILQEVSCQGMAKRVATGRLGEPSLAGGFFDGLLQDGFMQGMSVRLTRHRMGVILRGWEDPLPAPLSARLGILPIQCIRQDDAA